MSTQSITLCEFGTISAGSGEQTVDHAYLPQKQFEQLEKFVLANQREEPEFGQLMTVSFQRGYGKVIKAQNTIQCADEFIRNIKKYLEAPELTRAMCYELLDRVVVGGHPKHTGKERVMDIVYKVDIASVLRYKLKNPINNDKAYGYNNSYALLMPVSVPLPIYR